MVTRRNKLLLLGLLIVGLFPITSPSLYMLRLLSGMFMFIALAQSWNILGGYTGYLNLGHVVFLGVGAYTSAVLSAHHGVSPFLIAPLAGLAAVVLAAVIGYPALRLRGPYFAVLTLALVSVAQLATQNITQVGGGLGIILPRTPFGLRRSEEIFYWVFLATAAVVVLVAYRLEKSRFGLSLIALRDDEEAARVFGVNVVRAKMTALMLSAFPAGFCGGIFAYQLGYIEPATVFDIGMSITFVLMVMLGGAGRWLGPILGAIIVYLLTETLVFVIPDALNRVLFGIILVAVIYTMPSGILGVLSRTRGGWRFWRRDRDASSRDSSVDELDAPSSQGVEVEVTARKPRERNSLDSSGG